jgi:hypothetical protein
VTLAAFTFLSAWNDFMWPLIILTDAERYTLPVALASLVGEHVQDTELMMAGSVLTTLPALVVFLLFQRAYLRASSRERQGLKRIAAVALAASFAVLVAANPVASAPAVRVLDSFESAAGWSAHPADGVGLSIGAESVQGTPALRLAVQFQGGGYAVAHKAFDFDLPENYAFTFRVRGDVPPNTLEFKLIDASGDNVWWSVRRDFVFGRDWQTIRIKKRQIAFAWGPAGGGELRHVAAIEFAVTAGQGGPRQRVDRRLASRRVAAAGTSAAATTCGILRAGGLRGDAGARCRFDHRLVQRRARRAPMGCSSISERRVNSAGCGSIGCRAGMPSTTGSSSPTTVRTGGASARCKATWEARISWISRVRVALRTLARRACSAAPRAWRSPRWPSNRSSGRPRARRSSLRWRARHRRHVSALDWGRAVVLGRWSVQTTIVAKVCSTRTAGSRSPRAAPRSSRSCTIKAGSSVGAKRTPPSRSKTAAYRSRACAGSVTI